MAYTWNALGQLTRDGVYTYTWDAAGRLITVTDACPERSRRGIPLRFASGTRATTLGFLYNGDGNRLARIVNGTLTTHTLDPSAGFAKHPERSEWTGQAVGLRLPEVIVEHDGGAATYYLHLPHGVATDDGAWSYGAAVPRYAQDASQTVWAACGSGWMPPGRW